MTALFGRSFEVSDRRKCHRRAARVSQVKSLSHNTHGPAEALPPTAMGFGKMDKVELSNDLVEEEAEGNDDRARNYPIDVVPECSWYVEQGAEGLTKSQQ